MDDLSTCVVLSTISGSLAKKGSVKVNHTKPKKSVIFGPDQSKLTILLFIWKERMMNMKKAKNAYENFGLSVQGLITNY